MRVKTSEAELQQDTDRCWKLIAAAVEDAFIRFFGLVGTEAKAMRGSKAGKNKLSALDENKPLAMNIKQEELSTLLWPSTMTTRAARCSRSSSRMARTSPARST